MLFLLLYALANEMIFKYNKTSAVGQILKKIKKCFFYSTIQCFISEQIDENLSVYECF